MDKNKAVIDFLLQCPTIQANPLYFNFADENGLEDSHHIISEKDSVIKPYVDGSILKSYTFTVATYKPIAFNAIVAGESDLNIETMAIAQSILDWVSEQADLQNYPDFGEGFVVEDMETLTSDPNLDGIDTSTNPPMVRYSVGVKLQYVDMTKMLWR